MGPEGVPEVGNVKCANWVGLMVQDDLRLSPSEYGDAQVRARRTGVTSLKYTTNGREPGARATRRIVNERSVRD